MLKVISLGLGVQSTALYYMSSMGEIPRADIAIMSDLGKEKKGTYDYIPYLEAWAEKNNGIPIVIRKEKNLFQDLLSCRNPEQKRFASVPAYTKNPDGSVGMLRRQCTGEYKIAVVDNYIRDYLYELKPGSRRPKTEVYKGISLDEMERMNIPQEAWKIHMYPFIGYKTLLHGGHKKIESKQMTRLDILNWYAEYNLLVPPKSSCVFCPYQSDFSYVDMKKNHPEDWEAACKVDEAIRDSSRQGVENPIYLHESCIPLRDVVFPEDAPDLWHGECSGGCHT